MSQAQLSRLLPLPDDELKQVIDYASTLSKAEAAEHFTNLLGDEPQVIDFIASFNARRVDPKPPVSASPATAPNSAPSSDIDAVPRHQRGKKKKPQIHTPAPRQVASFALGPGTAYSKKDQEDDYLVSRKSGSSTPSNINAGPSKAPPIKSATPPPTQSSRVPPSATGTLVSDLGLPKPKPKSNPNSRTSTPGPSGRNNNGNATKISIAGGVPMHGASTALSDLDQAIRSLEITTNPTHTTNSAAGIAARKCNCVAARHPLLAAAPNCTNCGKVVCIKEGPGSCTFCGEPLLSSAEVQSMIKELKADRGREKMAADREANKKHDNVKPSYVKPRQAIGPSPAEAMALEHRDRLLNFQSENAQRTTVRDEAADFDATVSGSMWSSPEERAMALKKQQKLLREMEWNALPEYEKRKQVVSIDISGRKVFKKTTMAKVERPPSPTDEVVSYRSILGETDGNRSANVQGGAFSQNPLLGGGMIRPLYDPSAGAEDGKKLAGRKDKKNTTWRRVQDDRDDNEAVILDGGVYGSGTTTSGGGGDEPECG